MDLLARAIKQDEEAQARKVEALAAVAALSEGATQDEVDAASAAAVEASDAADRTAANVKVQERIAADQAEARAAAPAAPVAGGTLVVRESLTYEKGNHERKFFEDLYKARSGNIQSLERLQRNNRETIEERKGKPEFRALNSTATTGGEFVPPIWMDAYIAAPTAGRAFANQLPNLPLPQYGGTVNWPRLDSLVTTAVHSDGGSVSSTDPSTDSLAVNIKLIAGQNDLSRELLERSHPGMDQAILASLVKAYNKNVDTYCLSDSSAGVLKATGFNAVAYTDASPTAPEFYPTIFQGLSKVASGVLEGATGIFMHSRRWYWLLSQVDSNNRPWIVPNENGPTNAVGISTNIAAEGYVGTILGVPVYMDNNIPATDGTGTNQDSVLISRLDNMFLMEDGVRSFQFNEVLSGTGQIRLQVVGYVGFGIYHLLGNSVVAGTGLTAPTGF